MQRSRQAKWDMLPLLTAGLLAIGNLAFGLRHTWDSPICTDNRMKAELKPSDVHGNNPAGLVGDGWRLTAGLCLLAVCAGTGGQPTCCEMCFSPALLQPSRGFVSLVGVLAAQRGPAAVMQDGASHQRATKIPTPCCCLWEVGDVKWCPPILGIGRVGLTYCHWVCIKDDGSYCNPWSLRKKVLS